MLQVKLLGQFAVRRDGVLIALPSRAAQSLLAYLVLTAGTPHRRERLAGLLWPDTTEENARKNLRHELWRLRKAIEPKMPSRGQARGAPSPCLLVDDMAIAFDAGADYALDVADLLAPLPKQVSVDRLIEALSLYRGELLPDLYDDWVIRERERVYAIFEQKMARLLALLIQEERWQDTLDWSERWIALGQAPEPAYRALMTAHHALGNVSQVAAVYERCTRAMHDDLGVEPSAETQALYERLAKSAHTPAPSPSPARAEPVAPSLAPVLRTQAVTRKNALPVPLTSFIGREREIKEAKQLLAGTRVLTLTGPGGVGKTRLAIQVARELERQYQDRVWWVDLVALSDPALVPQTVAKALAVRNASNVSLVDTLAQALCPTPALLVLDNCEHLIVACAQLTQALLTSCAALKILATSREALGLAGETITRVPSLSLPGPDDPSLVDNIDRYESVRLFVERSRAIKSDFAASSQNARAVVGICRRLDGIPLAIELAAARVNLLSAEEIERRLDHRFALLTTGSRTALPRQQTLRATIDWSYDLLSGAEQVLFRRLSVFAGGATLNAAEQICGGDGLHVLDLMGHLVNKSLVHVEHNAAGETRYRLLETIREYAREKLSAAGEEDGVRERHLEYFRDLAEQAEPYLFASQVTWFYRLEADIDNIRAAVEWAMQAESLEKATPSDRAQSGLRLAAALAMFWESRYPLDNATLLRHVVANSGARSRTVARARALNTAGFLEWSLGNWDHARLFLQEALEIAREVGDKASIAWALDYLGTVACAKGDYGTARILLEEAIVLGRDLGTSGENIRGYALCMLGDVPFSAGDYAGARILYQESVAVLEEVGNKNMLAYPLRRLSYLALAEGDIEQAARLIEQSLALNREVGNQKGILASIAGMAALRTRRGERARAAKLFGAVDALLGAMKSPLFHSDRVEYGRYVTEARALLDDATFGAAWSEGRALSLEQVVAYALNR